MADEATTTAAAPAQTNTNADVAATGATEGGLLSQAPEGDAATTESTQANPDASTAADSSATDGKGLLSQDADKKPEGEVEDKKEGGDDADKGDAEGAPEAYEDFQVPEGMQIDQSMVDAISPLLKDANLTQDQAQKFVDAYAERKQAEAEQVMENFVKLQSEWVAEARSMPDSEKMIADANFVLRSDLFTEEARQFIRGEDGKGYIQNHPGFIKSLSKIAPLIKEDSFLDGGTKGAAKTAAQIMYPNLPSAGG